MFSFSLSSHETNFYDCGWGENIAYGDTIAEQQVNQERKIFFKKMAQYIKDSKDGLAEKHP